MNSKKKKVKILIAMNSRNLKRKLKSKMYNNNFLFLYYIDARVLSEMKRKKVRALSNYIFNIIRFRNGFFFVFPKGGVTRW